MSAVLRIPAGGTSLDMKASADDPSLIELPVRVNDATIVSNDYNHADSLEVSLAYADAGIDPRFLHAASVQFYMGQASPNGLWLPTKEKLRFCGVLTRARRQMSAGGATVNLSFVDYTALFLETKNYPLKNAPKFSQTISQAWATICDNTGVPLENGEIYSTVSALKKSIRFSKGARDAKLGEAVLPRFAQLGGPMYAPNSDSWGVWQQTVQAMGLISYIYLDECIVTTAEDYYTATDTPRLVWGENILEYEDERNTHFARKGIRVVSYDPITNTTLESTYPPDGDTRIKGKKPAVATSPKAKAPAAAKPPQVVASDRETFQYPSVTSQSRLDMISQRIFEERSRQEYEGHVKTCEMEIPTTMQADGARGFDMLNLKAGDTISIEYDVQNRLALSSFGSKAARIAALVERGYSAQIAELMNKNMQQILELPAKQFVKSVTTHFTVDEHSGDFDVTINFCNRINLDGST